MNSRNLCQLAPVSDARAWMIHRNRNRRTSTLAA
jgi:hypothetical protein